jgi:uncharacterized protein (DUF433 family)
MATTTKYNTATPEPAPMTYQHLAPNPKSAYKQLFVKGRRIRAWVLYCDHVSSEPMSAEQIAEDRELPLEAVREAIAYCALKPPEVEQDLRDEEQHMRAAGLLNGRSQTSLTPVVIPPK